MASTVARVLTNSPSLSGVDRFEDESRTCDGQNDGRVRVEADDVTEIGNDVTTFVCAFPV